MNHLRLAAAAAALTFAAVSAQPALAAPPTKRNVIIFVADGLRYDSVTPENAPTMSKVKAEGVDFANSHAMYPTLTTANASAIATGHYLGDTGNYANTLYTGFPIDCAVTPPAKVVFVENDCVLSQIKQHFGKGYIGQTTLLEAARAAGYNTAIIGKQGPAAIQWLGALKATNDFVYGPKGIFIDDATNYGKNLDGTPTDSPMINQPLLSDVFGAAGTGKPPFPAAPNLAQQGFMTAVASQALIPALRNDGKPFVMLFWSRDPDTTQHGAADSMGKVVPGINSVDAHQAIYNADSDLRSLLQALKLWKLDGNTDVFVTADHGFSTIGNGIPTADGTLERSTLGRGFVAIDIAHWLKAKMFDPDQSDLEVHYDEGERPENGSAYIGPSANHPKVIVVANGGSDFIYVPEGADKAATAKLVYSHLVQQPYVGGLFVKDELMAKDGRAFAGALRMSQINLMGAGKMPRPDIVISFRSFVAKGCTLSAQLCTAEIADTGLQTGQGMHGSFSRADTHNFMAAIGPDFKAGFRNSAPVSNADIAPTLAHILGIKVPSGPGTLTGRVATEALKGGKDVAVSHGELKAEKGPGGVQTVLKYQQVGNTRYFDAGGIPGRTVGISP